MSYLERGEVTSEQILSAEEHTRRRNLVLRAAIGMLSNVGWPWLEKKSFIVFGSAAREEATAASDFDVAIVVDLKFNAQTEFNNFDWKLRRALQSNVYSCGVDFEVHVTTVSNAWLQCDDECYLLPGVTDAIKRDGLPLFDR